MSADSSSLTPTHTTPPPLFTTSLTKKRILVYVYVVLVLMYMWCLYYTDTHMHTHNSSTSVYHNPDKKRIHVYMWCLY